jgi:hypothetical protein
LSAADLFAEAQAARARHLAALRVLVISDRRHQWIAFPDGWDCHRCRASLSDLAPLAAAEKIIAQPCPAPPAAA